MDEGDIKPPIPGREMEYGGETGAPTLLDRPLPAGLDPDLEKYLKKVVQKMSTGAPVSNNEIDLLRYFKVYPMAGETPGPTFEPPPLPTGEEEMEKEKTDPSNLEVLQEAAKEISKEVGKKGDALSKVLKDKELREKFLQELLKQFKR